MKGSNLTNTNIYFSDSDKILTEVLEVNDADNELSINDGHIQDISGIGYA